jgi:hypothetical protein
MTKYYANYRKGMKKGAGGKYYYPKSKGNKKTKATTTSVKKTANTLAKIGEIKEREDDMTVDVSLQNYGSATNPQIVAQRFGIQTDACNLFLPTAYTHMEVATPGGFFPQQKDGMEGRSIFARSLSMKLKVTFPQNRDVLQGDHDLFLIHGYCRAPYFPQDTHTQATDIDGSGAIDQTNEVTMRLPSREHITQETLADYVLAQVREHLDSKVDRMDWNNKPSKNGFTIIRKKKIFSTQWKQNQSGGSSDRVGGPQTQYHKIDWSMNKKCQFEQSDGFPTAVFNNGLCMYPNYSSIPFVVLYNPGYAQQGVPSADVIPGVSTSGVIQVRTASKLWFMDS